MLWIRLLDGRYISQFPLYECVNRTQAYNYIQTFFIRVNLRWRDHNQSVSLLSVDFYYCLYQRLFWVSSFLPTPSQRQQKLILNLEFNIDFERIALTDNRFYLTKVRFNCRLMLNSVSVFNLTELTKNTWKIETTHWQRVLLVRMISKQSLFVYVYTYVYIYDRLYSL